MAKFYHTELELGRPEEYRMKALQCLLAAERMHGPAERIIVLQIAQFWLTLADRASSKTVAGPSNDRILAERDKGSSARGVDAGLIS
jgi:hypothetical protein